MRLRYFKPAEFCCKCCTLSNMDMEFLLTLDCARHLAGIPFVVTSGFRCTRHNANEGGKKDSSHLVGLAADIECGNSRDRFLIISALLNIGFTRIGVRKDFIHVDRDPCKPPRVIWGY